MQISAPVSIPPEIAQLANIYQFGASRTHYAGNQQEANQRVGRGILILIVGLIPGFIASKALTTSGEALSSITILLLIIALVLVIIGVIQIAWRQNKHLHVYVYEAGLIYQGDDQGVQPVRWDQIQAIWRDVTRHYTHYRRGIYTVDRKCKYTIRCINGYEAIFTNRIAGIEHLGEHICTQVSKILLPASMQSYEDGQTITFGSLSLNQQGISNKGELLPWSQVETIDRKDGVISVMREGGWRRWVKEQESNIPNLSVFLSLVEHALK